MADQPNHPQRKTLPRIPASDPRFKWTSGADVQSTWRKWGWTPPSEGRTEFYEEPAKPVPVQLVKFKAR